MSPHQIPLPMTDQYDNLESLTSILDTFMQYNPSVTKFLDQCNVQPNSAAFWEAASAAVSVLLSDELETTK